MRENNIQIKNGRVIDPKSGFDDKADVFVVNGLVAAIGTPPQGFVADRVIDATQCIVSPGLVDMSVRLPSLESELNAAVAGGVTAVACPPDTKPPLDEPGLVERLVRRSESLGLAKVFPIGALTKQLGGEKLAEMSSLARAGCIAFSQSNQPILDTQVLFRAMQYAATSNFSVRLNPQDHYLSRDGAAHDGEVASRLGLSAIPVCAETIAISTAIQVAQATGARLHLTRLSSAAGVNLVREAQAQGVKVTADVSINHLHLTDNDIGYFDSHARFDPPLRSARDRDALRKAAVDGIVSICSDHTPVDEDGKQLPFGEAVPGGVGLELLLPLVLKWAEDDKVPLTTALARVTCDPAQVLGVAGGEITVGKAADLCVFDPSIMWQVDATNLRSEAQNTPFIGHVMSGRNKATLVNGQVVFAAK